VVVVDGVVVIDRWIWYGAATLPRGVKAMMARPKILYDSVLPVHHLKPVTTI
jgi:hypothetical protein